jgi:ankyrin repeat protein
MSSKGKTTADLLIQACQEGKLEDLRENQKMSLQTVQDNEGNNLLMIAASKGYLDIIQYFLEDANFGENYLNARNKVMKERALSDQSCVCLSMID